MISLVAQNYKALDARKFSWLFFGKVFPVLILFLITIVYSRKLSFVDYGQFQSVWMYANIISVILGFGITTIIFSTNENALFSFIAKNKNQLLKFYSLLWVLILIGFLFFSKNFTNSQRILIAVFIIIQNLNTAVESLVIKNGGEKKYFILNAFYAACFFGWHIFIIGTGYSLLNLMIGILVLSIIKLAILFWLLNIPSSSRQNIPAERSFTKHWFFVGLYDIIGIVSKWVDKLILLYMLSSAEFAIFFNGSIEVPFLSMLISAAGIYMMLQMSKNTQHPNRVQSVFKENFLMLSSIVFPLFFFLFIFRYDLFMLFFGEAYQASVPVFAISLLILPLRINDYSSILQCYSQGKKVAAGSVIDLALAVALVFILYPLMGMQGAALAMVISTFVQIIYYLYQSARTLKIKITELVPLVFLLQRLILTGIVFFALRTLLKNTNSFIAISSGILLMIFCMLIMGRKYVKKNT